VLADAHEATTADLRQAVAAYRAGKLDEVEVLCDRILKEQPDHIASLQLLAASFGQRGQPRRGIELLERALSLCPASVDSYVQLAKLLRLEGRNPEAIAALKKAIDIQPQSAAAYNDLGLICLAEMDVAQAVDCFSQAIEINPDLAIAHHNRGLALEQERPAEAIASFRQAACIDANFAEAYAKLGNLLLSEGSRAEALECFRRAAAARPDSALAFISQAKILLEEEKPAAAEKLVRRAIDLAPRNSDAYCLLSTILMELGRFHEGAVFSDVALALNRRQINAYHKLVHVKKLTEADRPLIAQMEWVLKECKLADDEQADLHFALGKGYDDLGEYEMAIQHFDLGNGLKHRLTSFDPAQLALMVDRVNARFTADFFLRNAALGSDWEVPIFIVGMPRSGTTLVEQILSSHPEVAARGELAFWAERAPSFRANSRGDIDPAWVNEVANGCRALLTSISSTARRITDKRPNNFNFIGLIHSVRARIIHCQRHPIDTCLSIYFQNFARRIDFAYDRGDLLFAYRQYRRLMAHWRSVLPMDRFLEIQYEELVADREAVSRKMIGFIGLDWNDACLRSEQNRRPVRTASVWQARQPVYRTSVARWRRYESWLGVLRELLPDVEGSGVRNPPPPIDSSPIGSGIPIGTEHT
jgi:tetratricopeptide (TPR) repeat protein